MTNEQIRLLSKMKKLINEGKRRFANRKDRDYLASLLELGITESEAWNYILRLSVHYYYPDFEIILLNNKRIVLELKPANLVKKSREVFNKKIYAQKYYWKQKAKYIILTEKELYKTPKGGFFRIFDYI